MIYFTKMSIKLNFLIPTVVFSSIIIILLESKLTYDFDCMWLWIEFSEMIVWYNNKP